MLPKDNRVIFFKSTFANKNLICRAVWERFKLPRLINRLKVDVLFVPGGMDFTSSNLSQPKVTMFRNMLPFDKVALDALSSKVLYLKNIILKQLMVRTMNGADHVIFISTHAKKSIEHELSLKNSSIIYHGIAANFVSMSASKDVDNNLADYILYVSRFEPYKNHLNVIKAYAKLNKELRSKHKLVIVGEHMEPSYSLCMDFIKSNSLERFIEIKGNVPYDKLPHLYQNTALFVFASSCENCPNILLEAIGCGAPIISSKTEPMPEFGKNAALYFDEKDPESIFSKMNEVLNNESLSVELRVKSTNLRQEYTWVNTAQLTWKCLESNGVKNV